MAGRADSLESAARSELAARERAAARRERRRREAAVAEAVRQGASYAAVRVASSLELATTARAAAEAARTEREAALATVRREIGTLGDELRELTDSVHRDEVARTAAAAADRDAADQGGRGARHRPRRARGGLRPAPAGAASCPTRR